MTRLSAQERRAIIVLAGVEIANKYGLVAVSFTRTAEACSVETSVATVRDYFRTLAELRTAIGRDPRATPVTRNQAVALGLDVAVIA